MKHMAQAVGLLALLAGCGGGGGGGGGGSSGGGGPGIDPRLGRLDIYESQKLRVLGDPGAGVMAMPVTLAENVPTTGTFVFDGSATIRVEDPVRPLVIFGDATVSLAFGEGCTSGRLDNFFGTDSSGGVVDFAGQIDLSGAAAAQDFEVDYDGTLTAAGQNVVFDGTLQGTLLGNPVGALTAAELEALVDLNGDTVDATVIVIAETDD
jgi:hypothetical protein